MKSNAAGAFEKGAKSPNHEMREAALFEEVGRLKFEVDWLKKKSVQLGVLRGDE